MLALGGIAGVVNRRVRVVGHVGDMDNTTVECGFAGRDKIFLVGFTAAGVVSGVDVNVAHARKNQAVVIEDNVGSSQLFSDLDDLGGLDPYLSRDNLFRAD